MNKVMEVTAIENGTVIDHIPAKSLFKIIHILDLEQETNQITFGTNLKSKRLGTKAIIKISNRHCAEAEIDKIAIVAPQAKVNIIRDFQVVEKRVVKAPEHIEGFVKCANPHCITNNEKMLTKFDVLTSPSGEVLEFHCHYCEKNTPIEDAVLTK